MSNSLERMLKLKILMNKYLLFVCNVQRSEDLLYKNLASNINQKHQLKGYGTSSFGQLIHHFKNKVTKSQNDLYSLNGLLNKLDQLNTERNYLIHSFFSDYESLFNNSEEFNDTVCEEALGVVTNALNISENCIELLSSCIIYNKNYNRIPELPAKIRQSISFEECSKKTNATLVIFKLFTCFRNIATIDYLLKKIVIAINNVCGLSETIDDWTINKSLDYIVKVSRKNKQVLRIIDKPRQEKARKMKNTRNYVVHYLFVDWCTKLKTNDFINIINNPSFNKGLANISVALNSLLKTLKNCNSNIDN